MQITDHLGNTMYPLYRKLANQAQEGTDISSWKQKEDFNQLNYEKYLYKRPGYSCDGEM